MSTGMNARVGLAVVGLLAAAAMVGTSWAQNYFPSFADDHTVGLWLFDETDYPYTTLTDASRFEYDLRLMKGGRLVPGRYGNCLKCTPGRDYVVSYAAWKGAVGFNRMREVSGRPGSGLFGPTIAPEQLLQGLAESDFTCEFWLLLMSNPIQDTVLIDLGDKYEPGFTVILRKAGAGFVVENAYAGFRAVCPALLEQIWSRAWHHIAFTYSRGRGRLRYFIDGKEQQAPTVSKMRKVKIPAAVRPESVAHTTYGIFEKEDRKAVPDFPKRIAHRFNFALGHDRHGERDFDGNIDELRFSNVVRYTGDFALPGSFSRNYDRKPEKANGPPLLFGPDKTYLPNEPVNIGSRKHVFIDDVLVDRQWNVTAVLNPPTNPVRLNIQAAWDASFFEHKGKIYTVKAEGYECDEGRIRLFVSTDGVHFEAPELGVVEYKGSKSNNLIMLGLPSWGKYFKDSNPACPGEELFKATLWVAQRGIYMYFSPDAIHWRRNEVCMLPLVSGGGCETFWDDQQGLYLNYIKRDGSYSTGEYPNYGRSVTMFKTAEPTKAWPINKVPNPYYEGWPFPAVTGEGLTVMGPNILDPDNGQIFRTRPQKYPWAPDTYVAFLIRRTADMATSRDGVHWRICSEDGLGYYLPQSIRLEGNPIRAGDIANGLIRRGDKIWQYANIAAPGKGRSGTCRFEQRLDGFMSLDAGEKMGVIITRPIIFDGDKLVINADVKGYLRVGIMGLAGKPMTAYNIALTNPPKKASTGYAVHECDPITGDSVRHVVSWGGNSFVGNLAGTVVRLRFEMENAKLYAFKFD